MIEPFLAIIVGLLWPAGYVCWLFCLPFENFAEGLAVQASSGGFDAVWECCQVANKTHFGKSAAAQAYNSQHTGAFFTSRRLPAFVGGMCLSLEAWIVTSSLSSSPCASSLAWGCP